MEDNHLSELIQVIDSRGRTLSPCRRKVAEREVRLNRARWMGKNSIRLRFDPFAYRYVRLKVLERDGHTCYWCGQPGHTMDHVIPWSQGGRTTMNNCICACEECNGARGDMPAEEFAKLKNVEPPKPEGGPSPELIHLAREAAGRIAAWRSRKRPRATGGASAVGGGMAAAAVAEAPAPVLAAATPVAVKAVPAAKVAPAARVAPAAKVARAPVTRPAATPVLQNPSPLLRDLLDPDIRPVSLRLFY